MKKEQLNELVRLIVRGIVKEYLSTSTSSTSSTNTNGDDTDLTQKPEDAMTPAEKSKAERDAQKTHLAKVRTANLDLKGVKTQSDYFKQTLKKNNLDIIAKEKELSNLKAGKTIATGGAGSTIA